MSDRPAQNEIDEQVEWMCRHGGLKNARYGKLFRYLVQVQKEGRFQQTTVPATATNILREFYEQDSPKPVTDQYDDAGRQLVRDARNEVDLYFYRLDASSRDSIIITIPEGAGTGHEPQYRRRRPGSVAFQDSDLNAQRLEVNAQVGGTDQGDFKYLGTCIEAMKEYVKLVPGADKIEDTTVRWHESSRQAVYPESLMTDLSEALLKNERLQFHLITSPIIDINYSLAVSSAYLDKDRPASLKAWRLHHTAPLMNFTIFYPSKHSNQKKTVFFGYGKHTGQGFSLESTSVFSSTNLELIKEFQRLFTVLKDEEISRPISPFDPDFAVSYAYQSDIVASFPGWPSEIATRIEECRRSVRICVAGWSQLDTHVTALEELLRQKKEVTIGLWDPNSKFVKARSERYSPIKGTLKSNFTRLKPLEKLYPDHLKVLRCMGWGSVSIFWIDEYIYFGIYWTSKSTLLVRFFLVYEKSKTGEKLSTEYEEMMGSAMRARSRRR